MKLTLPTITTTGTATLLTLLAASSTLGKDDQHNHDHSKPQTHDAERTTDEQREVRPGDPYTLEMCPVSGMALESMGDPVIKNIAGRDGWRRLFRLLWPTRQ